MYKGIQIIGILNLYKNTDVFDTCSDREVLI